MDIPIGALAYQMIQVERIRTHVREVDVSQPTAMTFVAEPLSDIEDLCRLLQYVLLHAGIAVSKVSIDRVHRRVTIDLGPTQ